MPVAVLTDVAVLKVHSNAPLIHIGFVRIEGNPSKKTLHQLFGMEAQGPLLCSPWVVFGVPCRELVFCTIPGHVIFPERGYRSRLDQLP